MTLIATVWSPQGFAIAADGFEFRHDSKEPTGDVQKIFSTAFANETGFAWAWNGSITGEFESGLRFDLKEITERVMAELPDDAYMDEPEEYFNRIAMRIYYELPTDVDLSKHPDSEIIFVGT